MRKKSCFNHYRKKKERKYKEKRGRRKDTPEKLFQSEFDSIFLSAESTFAYAALESVESYGYEIWINFEAEDVFHGNVVVKINEKWFAIGEAEWHKNEFGERYCVVTEIWPREYVLSKISKLETEPEHTVRVPRYW